jgi:hypothetical protein
MLHAKVEAVFELKLRPLPVQYKEEVKGYKITGIVKIIVVKVCLIVKHKVKRMRPK